MPPRGPATVPSAQPTPMPSFMSPDQVAHYLSELRSYRPPRPSGARPLASKDDPAVPSSRKEAGHISVTNEDSSPHDKKPVETSKRWSTASRHSMMHDSITSSQQLGGETATKPAEENPSTRTYHIPYYERGQRWMEKQEAHSLTRALQEKDSREDARVYSAAQQEAAHLMWKHQNPHAPYANPNFDFRQHLRKGSHARSQSIGPFQELYVHKRGSSDAVDSPTDGSRNVSSGSNATTSTQSSGSKYGMSMNDGVVQQAHSGSLRERAIASFSLPIRKSRRSSGHRSSGHGSRKASDESSAAPFPNPEDRIYEEPEEVQEISQPQQQDSQLPLRAKARNTSYGNVTQGTDRDALAKPATLPFSAPKPGLRYKNGIEVRGEDIRAATSMKLRDRSPRLPQPSVVSDRPGRPIISFEPNFYAKRAEGTPKPDQPAASPSGGTPSFRPLGSERSNHSSSEALQGTVPQIQVEGIPSISISSEAEPEVEPPTILVSGSDALPRKPRTSVDQRLKNPPRFDQPREAREQPSKRSHWSPALANRRTQAQCASCALGIEGKIVSAAGERFHPECFTCYQCGELLECVAFYPEPEKARSERLQRHADQLAGQSVSGGSECVSDDGDPSLRFYCHLDFHEKFSPRCRNCKTPIEGKVVVACGGEWHEGHFFCAECGDPFDPTIPYIEKDGYAWCVPCHSRRFSGKCAGCRKPVTDMVINALGKEWHEACFCCRECGSQFDDGRFFTPTESEGPICVKCEERRLKA